MEINWIDAQAKFVCWLFFLRALQSQRVETHTRWMDAYRLSDGAFDIERLPINFMCAQFPVALVMAQARHCIDLDQDSRSYKTTRHHTIQLYIHQNLVLFVITFNCYHRSNSKAQIDKCHFQSTFLINVNATRRWLLIVQCPCGIVNWMKEHDLYPTVTVTAWILISFASARRWLWRLSCVHFCLSFGESVYVSVRDSASSY